MRIIGFVTRKTYVPPSGDFTEGLNIIEIEGLKVFANEDLSAAMGLMDIPSGTTICVDVRVSFKKDKPPSFWAQSITAWKQGASDAVQP